MIHSPSSAVPPVAPALLPAPSPGNLLALLAEELASLDADATLRDTVADTLFRCAAMSLLHLGMKDSDIHYVCAVPNYFLGKAADDLDRASQRLLANHQARPRGGNTPGVWSICRTKPVQLEAVRFIVDWATAGHPFTPRPNPLAFDTVYRHYREWGWDDAERSPLGPSTCLAIIRNVRSGKLVLQYCRMCQRLHVRAVHPEEIGHGGPQVCIFCHSPHTISCSLTPDHRLLKPA